MSMRDYRNPPWVSSPSYMVPPQYAPPPHPQSTSPMEEAILNLTKLVGNFVEAHKTINAQLCQKIDTMENNVNKRIDGLQSEMEHKSDNQQYSISKLASQQHAHQEGENPEEECLSDTIVDEQCQQQGSSESLGICAAVYPWEKKEEILPLLSKEGSGKGAVEDHQEHNLPFPPSDSMCILPTAQPTPGAPTGKVTSIALPVLQKFKKLVATVQAFATTSKTMAVAHTAWHSGWFGCRFGFGAPEPLHF